MLSLEQKREIVDGWRYSSYFNEAQLRVLANRLDLGGMKGFELDAKFQAGWDQLTKAWENLHQYSDEEKVILMTTSYNDSQTISILGG